MSVSDAEPPAAPVADRCPRCGTDVAPPARFCAGCGAPLTGAATSAAGPEAADDQEPALDADPTVPDPAVEPDRPDPDPGLDPDPADPDPAAEPDPTAEVDPAVPDPAAGPDPLAESDPADPEAGASDAEVAGLAAEAGFVEQAREPGDDGHPADAGTGEAADDVDEAPGDDVDTTSTGRLQVSPGATLGELTAERPCSACGWGNPPERELCVRCGADLDTGVVPPWPAPSPERLEDIGVATTTRRRRRWWVPLVAVMGVAALVVAALALAEVGPFATGPEVPEAGFDAAAYPEGAVRPLTLSEIATLTTAEPQEDRSFTASQMVDGDVTTAWLADADALPEGADETIDLVLAAPAWVDQLVVDNGDQLDGDRYAAAARVQRARVTFDGGASVVVNLLDAGREPQVVRFPEPSLTTAVRIEVLEVFAGDDGPDPAVSDLELLGWPASGGDVALAEERAAVLPATDGTARTSAVGTRWGRGPTAPGPDPQDR
jgi:hypothetical protein